MSAELFTNEFQVVEVNREPKHPSSEHLGALSLTLEITPPPDDERLATAISVASIYQLDRPGFFRARTHEEDKTVLDADIYARHADERTERALQGTLHLYADSFSNTVAAILNAKPEAVLSVADRLMRGDLIPGSPIVRRFKKQGE